MEKSPLEGRETSEYGLKGKTGPGKISKKVRSPLEGRPATIQD